MRCRHCSTPLDHLVLDLGSTVPANLPLDTADGPEQPYPLRLLKCDNCHLVQTDIDLFRLDQDEVFSAQYPYFSSSHPAFVAHAKQYAGRMIEMLGLDSKSKVVEIGSNDGYLLRHFKDRGIPCWGFEPTNTSLEAMRHGVPTIQRFFSRHEASRFVVGKGPSDLVVCNNVLAHVPDINGFLSGVTTLLKSNGIATFEFPSLLNLVKEGQWDTVYHEHYSYLSFTVAREIMRKAGLDVFDVEPIPTHGGSLRVFATRHGGASVHKPSIWEHLDLEQYLSSWAPYHGLQVTADASRYGLLVFLQDCRNKGKHVAGFGAAAKGNTLLNFAQVGPDLLPYIVDDTHAKQGKFAPGSRVPIVSEFKSRPDYILVLPWNWLPQIKSRLAKEIEAGAKIVTAVPELEVA